MNTLGLASAATFFVRLEHPHDLPALARERQARGGLLVLGGGSNVVLPARVPGLVASVALRGMRLLEARGSDVLVEAAAGESWHGFVAHCVDHGWTGLENLALIPGTVGAAPVQNIGAYGVELRDRFEGLTAFDLLQERWVDMKAGDCGFAYRDSIFKREPGRWVIAAVRVRLSCAWQPVLGYPDLSRHFAGGEAPTPRAVFDAVCQIRRQKLPDPAVLGNAGSFFKNPVVDADVYSALRARFPELVGYEQPTGEVKLAAGWLIDRCGWKGRTMGPAGVHDKQALVLVNHGGAQANDILALADAVRADVLRCYGVALEIEPVVVPAG